MERTYVPFECRADSWTANVLWYCCIPASQRVYCIMCSATQINITVTVRLDDWGWSIWTTDLGMILQIIYLSLSNKMYVEAQSYALLQLVCKFGVPARLDSTPVCGDYAGDCFVPWYVIRFVRASIEGSITLYHWPTPQKVFSARFCSDPPPSLPPSRPPPRIPTAVPQSVRMCSCVPEGAGPCLTAAPDFANVTGLARTHTRTPRTPPRSLCRRPRNFAGERAQAHRHT